MHKQEAVLDGDGEMISLAPPTFDPTMWQRIQDAAGSCVSSTSASRHSQPTPCWGLDTAVSVVRLCLSNSHGGRRLRVASTSTATTDAVGHRSIAPGQHEGRGWRSNPARNVSGEVGSEKVTRRVFVPGEDRTHELDTVIATIDRLRRESDAGLIVSEDDERVYLTTHEGAG